MLNLLAHAYLSEDDEAIYTTHGFLVYPIATLACGAKPIVAAEKNYTADVDAILAAVNERTRIIFLANPNNPQTERVIKAMQEATQTRGVQLETLSAATQRVTEPPDDMALPQGATRVDRQLTAPF